MSDENVERLEIAYEALNRGDFDAAVERAHPEIEFVRSAGLPPLRGMDALRAWMEPDAWETQTLEPLDFRPNGNKVLVHQRNKARGAGSGIEMEAEAWAVWTFDDEGRATRLEAFLSNEKAEALKAAGLRE